MNRGETNRERAGQLRSCPVRFFEGASEIRNPGSENFNSARKPVKKKEEIQILRGIKDLEHIAPKRKALYQKEAFDGEYSDSLREKRA